VDLSPTTLRTYRSQIERKNHPYLGKVTFTRLTAKNLHDPYGVMKDSGMSPKTIRNHHAVISAALHCHRLAPYLPPIPSSDMPSQEALSAPRGSRSMLEGTSKHIVDRCSTV
jgi:hypothetical protein